MFISFFVEIAYCAGRYFGSPEGFCNVFYTSYRNTCQIYFNQGFFYGSFPAAVAFNNGSFKRNTLDFGNIELYFTSCCLEVPLIMAGAVALAFSRALILLGAYQFICFLIKQGVECLFHAGADN